MLIAMGLLVLAGLLGWLTVRLVRQIVGAFPTMLPMPPEPELATRIGQVLSDGMDRVEAMRHFGADRFLTFMPMPDGTCWSVTVVRHPDEAAAKASYSRVPAVTH